jgi:hypothetical protein
MPAFKLFWGVMPHFYDASKISTSCNVNQHAKLSRLGVETASNSFHHRVLRRTASILCCREIPRLTRTVFQPAITADRFGSQFWVEPVEALFAFESNQIL